MRSFKRAVVQLVYCFVLATFGSAIASPSALDKGYGRAPTITEIKRWIGKAIIPNAGMPPPPTTEELSELEKGGCPEGMIPQEVEVCRRYFRADPELLTWAARDTDGDGTQDFMVSFVDGKFHEGDLDIDGDGVLNIVDSQPFDSQIGGADLGGDGFPDIGFPDSNHNLIPDFVDWQWDGAHSAELGLLQKRIYDKFRIILAERDAKFDLVMVQAIYDSLDLVFSNWIIPTKGISTLRSIVAERASTVLPGSDQETNAVMLSVPKSMIIYSCSMQYDPIVKLGLLVHEISHAIQYKIDERFDSEVEAAKRDPNDLSPFLTLMAEVDWSRLRSTAPRAETFWMSSVYDINVSLFLFRGQTAEQWSAWLDRISKETGKDPLLSEKAENQFIIGEYSLTDPWEYYADHMIANLFLSIEGALPFALEDGSRQKELNGILKRLRKAVSTNWPDFQYGNATNGETLNWIRERHPLSSQAIDAMVKRYVVDAMDADD